MPWCPACDRYLSPPSVTAGGRCPSCGGPVQARSPEGGGNGEEEELPGIPLHLKVLGVAAAVYLGWRVVQGVQWVVSRF